MAASRAAKKQKTREEQEGNAEESEQDAGRVSDEESDFEQRADGPIHADVREGLDPTHIFKDLHDPQKLRVVRDAHNFLEETRPVTCSNCGCRWFRFEAPPQDWMLPLEADASFGTGANDVCAKCCKSNVEDVMRYSYHHLILF